MKRGTGQRYLRCPIKDTQKLTDCTVQGLGRHGEARAMQRQTTAVSGAGAAREMPEVRSSRITARQIAEK